ncbi:alpha/beta fold hydrolase [Streptomyces sp. ISL-36]|uniref:alpha/beta fold hydrolase n=1 Tax=Streptomyces sp. ISL-36 TaxID=2819182 RepID=UPI001BE6CE7C|nr:alpha/beta fold hydrolase [Streptomyces sp. ISL-36]MBT2440085.1 alpha/beta fold hydrolase [Streptomyces sp. ISL-36]
MRPGWQCGTMVTPLDHARPGKETLELAVAKLPAKNAQERIGSLLTNPGGPGGSGIEAAAVGYWERHATEAVRQRFDLVAYDPRGVAHSRPALNCSATTPRAQQDDDDGFNPSPRNHREMLEELKEKDQSGANCVKYAGWLVPHMSTVDNVRDLDRLRQAVGDRKLSYLGVSYGTTIGAVYANLYPARVRSMILHGVVDAKTQARDTETYSISDAKGQEYALRAHLYACDRDPQHCAFAGDANAKFDRLAAHLRDTRRPDPAPREEWDRFVDLAWRFGGRAEDESEAQKVARELQELYEETFASSQSTVRTAQASKDNEVDVLKTTDCLDTPPLPKDNGPWLEWFHRARAQAPLFGPREALNNKYCRDWPDDFRAAAPRYTGPWNRAQVPILLTNQRFDHATPLNWARTMREAMGQRGLVVIHGHGHGEPTQCSISKSEAYLLHGQTPSGEVLCADGDTTPFH